MLRICINGAFWLKCVGFGHTYLIYNDRAQPMMKTFSNHTKPSSSVRQLHHFRLSSSTIIIEFGHIYYKFVRQKCLQADICTAINIVHVLFKTQEW